MRIRVFIIALVFVMISLSGCIVSADNEEICKMTVGTTENSIVHHYFEEDFTVYAGKEYYENRTGHWGGKNIIFNISSEPMFTVKKIDDTGVTIDVRGIEKVVPYNSQEYFFTEGITPYSYSVTFTQE